RCRTRRAGERARRRTPRQHPRTAAHAAAAAERDRRGCGASSTPNRPPPAHALAHARRGPSCHGRTRAARVIQIVAQVDERDELGGNCVPTWRTVAPVHWSRLALVGASAPGTSAPALLTQASQEEEVA